MSTHDHILVGLKLHRTLRGYKSEITKIGWSPDGRILARPSLDGIIRLWDVETKHLCHTLRGHSAGVSSVAWSPDGRTFASGSDDETIRIWDNETGEHLRTLEGHSSRVASIVWSPDGRMLASGSGDATIRLWNAQTGELHYVFEGHSQLVFSIAWSADGRTLASGSLDHTIRLWDVESRALRLILRGHTGYVFGIALSPDGRILASGSSDETIRIWDTEMGQQISVLEGHINAVQCVSFSFDGSLLASKSADGTVRLWRCDIWDTVAVLDEPGAYYWYPGLAFHPKAPVLATLGEDDKIIRVWELDLEVLLYGVPASNITHYTNAKVILVGDSGVGKSALGLVLAGQQFRPTESSHGRHVWTFENNEVELDSGHKETRETLLWDLAGQPGYRLIHQLHLNEVAVALVVFDAHSETDPFAGVRHWNRALNLAQYLQGASAPPIKKFLIGARSDLGGITVSQTRIDALIRELGFDGYFETSAKEGWNIVELAAAIHGAIDWNALPKVRSTNLFQRIKSFLLMEKKAGRLLSTADDLYRAFLTPSIGSAETEELHAQFKTCIGRVESRDLIKRFSFGDLILLRPELLDSYSSAMVIAAKDEPDGLGCISEEDALAGRFRMPKNERIKDREQEKLLLIATVEDLLRHEIVLREQGEDGPYLVFPSQSTRENPDLSNPEGKAVVFSFEGPVLNIYATLAVRLSHSGLFKKKELWKNAVTYTARVGGIYGMLLDNIGEGQAKLTLFFDKRAGEETRFHFEEYVEMHLKRRALPESIKRLRSFECNRCNAIMTEQIVRSRLARGLNWLNCPVCDNRVSLVDRKEELTIVVTSLVSKMDYAADMQRERSAGTSILQGKIATEDFDVFLCHNSKDKAKVKEIGEKLKERGILPWLDEWELPPGRPWQRLLEKQIGKIRAAAVFIGKDGIGPWEQMESEAFLRRFIKRACPIVPVLLADAHKKPKLPIFLEGMTWVDFRKRDPDPMERLIWGITGKKHNRTTSESS